MLTVCCVLRSGGDYDRRYVDALHHAVGRNLGVRHRFVCLSDVPADPLHISLKRDWPGWWSKIEVFRMPGPCIYFDLDTVIVSGIDALAEAVMGSTERRFWMLKPFKPTEKWASGVMAWNGNLWSLYEGFNAETDIPRFRWDQRYIGYRLHDQGIRIEPVQDHIPRIYSYKHHCRSGLPGDAQVVCFHGRPRPHEINESWVKEHWR